MCFALRCCGHTENYFSEVVSWKLCKLLVWMHIFCIMHEASSVERVCVCVCACARYEGSMPVRDSKQDGGDCGNGRWANAIDI